MGQKLKLSPSNRALAILFIAILAVSIVNAGFIAYSYFTLQDSLERNVADLNSILNQTRSSLSQVDDEIRSMLNGRIDNLDARMPIEQYDYVVYRFWDYEVNVSRYLAKNGRTGAVEFNSTDAAETLNAALAGGNSVYVKSDEYNVTSDITIINKKNARLDSDGARLLMHEKRIVVYGSNYDTSQANQVSGFVIVNGTLRVENSFRTTVTNIIFEDSKVGVELANTNTWTECTKIDTILFKRCVQALVFRTNTSDTALNQNATGSYGNTQVSRCYFNQLDHSVAITVEPQAEFTDGALENIRVWIGEFGNRNQTGLLLNGSMYKTRMDGVVFESFAVDPWQSGSDVYAIVVGNQSYQTPTFESGVNFLGSWTQRISNPSYRWIYGNGAVFRLTDISVPIGAANYGETAVVTIRPATISTFQPKITVHGSFAQNETVTVRVRLQFLDNSVTNNTYAVEKIFAAEGSSWLDSDELFTLMPSMNVIDAILIDAKVSRQLSDAKVSVDVFGTAV